MNETGGLGEDGVRLGNWGPELDFGGAVGTELAGIEAIEVLGVVFAVFAESDDSVPALVAESAVDRPADNHGDCHRCHCSLLEMIASSSPAIAYSGKGRVTCWSH